MAQINDESLVAQTRAGNSAAYAELVERYQSVVCAVAYAATGDRALSEDVAQEAFLAGWRQIDGLDRADAFRSWILGIARNQGHKARRRQGELADNNEAEFVDGQQSAFDKLATREDRGAVWHALEKIPESYREPLVLFYREDHSIREVAHGLAITEAAAQQRLSRGRAYLKGHVSGLVQDAICASKPRAGFAAAAVLLGISTADVGSAAASQAAAVTSVLWKGPIVKVSTKIALGIVLASIVVWFSWPHSDEQDMQDAASAVENTMRPIRSASRRQNGPPIRRVVAPSKDEQSSGRDVRTSPTARPSFEFEFLDVDRKHSDELSRAINLKSLLRFGSDCYEQFTQRRPELRVDFDRITVEIALEVDRDFGAVATDTELGVEVGSILDDEFKECFVESSFGVDFHEIPVELHDGYVRVSIFFPDKEITAGGREAAQQRCERELERRRNSGLQQDANDEQYASCIRRTIAIPELDTLELRAANTAIQPCLKEARERRPELNIAETAAGNLVIFGETIDDDHFNRCANRMLSSSQ